MVAESRWDNLDLDSYRKIGDGEADKLVEICLSDQGDKSVGRLGYNAMLMLADKLCEDPELLGVDDSRLVKQLKSMPSELVRYFDPMKAPEWVDEEKLKLGSELWQDNTLLVLFALYSASLPACYLMKNGIPALYKTEKLRDHKYIFQRIYETGMMLAETMDQDGIRIIHDSKYENDKLFLEAVSRLDKKGKWEKQGNCFCRTGSKASSEIDPNEIQQEIERLRGKADRYIWGKGYVTAKKIRFLHASMRYMLTHPVAVNESLGSTALPQKLSEAICQRSEAWDTDRFGVPVNQEDQAYTLLTFGYVIPRVLENLGHPISNDQKAAFLHLWRLIGHIMGIDEKLMTDDWHEAESLYKKIQERQAGESEEGHILTEALIGFLEDYMPKAPGFAHHFSATMIIRELGLTHASYLLKPSLLQETKSIWRKPVYWLMSTFVKIYLIVRTRCFKRFKHLGWITTYRLHEASELLIESWYDGYSRKPFFVPTNDTMWVRKPGIDETMLDALKQWRLKLFKSLGISVVFLIFAVLCLAASVPIVLFSGIAAFKTTLMISGVLWLTSIVLMHTWLPKVFKQRPKAFDSPF